MYVKLIYFIVLQLSNYNCFMVIEQDALTDGFSILKKPMNFFWRPDCCVGNYCSYFSNKPLF
ncbi:MAG: hypothetical protein BGO59_06090 [Spirosoma sp. 48-14]|nr:MAG: hypothetical protein BGO59_06090 [Spirosoma sp. 48-14]